MRKLWWAALCGAGALALALAGQAEANIVQVNVQGDFYYFWGPAGFFSAPRMIEGCYYGFREEPVSCTQDGVETVNYSSGGSGFTMSLEYNSALGTRTTTPDSDKITWTSGQGSSPIVSGYLSWPDVSIIDNLASATSVEITQDAGGYEILLDGENWFVNELGGGSIQYAHDQIAVYNGEHWSPDVTLISIPEPSSWALMLLGFGALGGVLRRLRAARPAQRQAPRTWRVWPWVAPMEVASGGRARLQRVEALRGPHSGAG